MTKARQDAETRDAALTKLKKTMTLEKVATLNAYDLMKLAKEFMPPEALRVTDSRSSNRRYLRKAELKALFISKFDLDPEPVETSRACVTKKPRGEPSGTRAVAELEMAEEVSMDLIFEEVALDAPRTQEAPPKSAIEAVFHTRVKHYPMMTTQAEEYCLQNFEGFERRKAPEPTVPIMDYVTSEVCFKCVPCLQNSQVKIHEAARDYVLAVLSGHIAFSPNRIGEAFDLLANDEYANYRGARAVLGEQLLFAIFSIVAGLDGSRELFLAVRRVLESLALFETIGNVLESPPRESVEVIEGLLKVMEMIERGALVDSLKAAQRPACRRKAD